MTNEQAMRFRHDIQPLMAAPPMTLQELLHWKTTGWNEASNPKKLETLPSLFWFLARTTHDVVAWPENQVLPEDELRFVKHCVRENAALMLELVNEFIKINIENKKPGS